MRFVRLKRPEAAFTTIVTFLTAEEPFSSFDAGLVVRTVSGAVRRGHYRIAAVNDGVEGVLCWALVDPPDLDAWLTGRSELDFDSAVNGSTVTLLMGRTRSPEITRLGWLHLRELYPGRSYLLRRSGRTRASTGRLTPATTQA